MKAFELSKVEIHQLVQSSLWRVGRLFRTCDDLDEDLRRCQPYKRATAFSGP